MRALFRFMGNDTHLMPTYGRLPVAFARGQNARLWDTEGKEYLDALSGIAVCSLGHCHPAVSAALCEQANTLVHTSNWYGIPKQEILADKLCTLSGMDKVFFSNSGAEANEAAIKLARVYGHQREILEPAIIVMEGSFHGRTMATLTATGNRKVQAGFEPLLKGFVRVPYNDLEAVRQVAGNNSNVVAVLVEPVLGEGGVIIPDDDYLPGLREICDANEWLLMLDEIQTGIGRTGKWFAHEHAGIKPDVMTLAKALGNGAPIGACLARGSAAEMLGAGRHGSTYGGNPLCCAAAIAVLDTIEQNNLVARAKALGDNILTGLQVTLDGTEGVVNIAGKGLMIGIRLDRECSALMGEALNAGLLLNVTAGNTVRLLPPFILSDAEAQRIVKDVSALIKHFLATQVAA